MAYFKKTPFLYLRQSTFSHSPRKDKELRETLKKTS